MGATDFGDEAKAKRRKRRRALQAQRQQRGAVSEELQIKKAKITALEESTKSRPAKGPKRLPRGTKSRPAKSSAASLSRGHRNDLRGKANNSQSGESTLALLRQEVAVTMSETYCVCQTHYLGVGFDMIQCSHCHRWYHLECLGYTADEAKTLQVAPEAMQLEWKCGQCLISL